MNTTELHQFITETYEAVAAEQDLELFAAGDDAPEVFNTEKLETDIQELRI